MAVAAMTASANGKMALAARMVIDLIPSAG